MHPNGYSRTLVGGLFLVGCAIGTPVCVAFSPTTLAVAPPPLLLANPFRASIDEAPYLVSEKYNGVRAHWDGRALRFRSGRPIPAPAWFLNRLPDQPLDGELWLGRGQFDALSGLVRSARADNDQWRQVRYMIFELPGADGSFGERAARINRIVHATSWSQLVAIKQERLESKAALEQLLEKTVAAGGEGLMLHLASAPYATGRSDVLVKLKPQHDAEAVVIAHRAGRGKYAGMLGALRLQGADGRPFWIGSGFSDAQRRDPPPIGGAVTYRCRDITPGGQPRFASFLRAHADF